MSHYRDRYEYDRHNHHGYEGHGNHYDFEYRIKNYFLNKLRNNKKLLLIPVIAIVIIIAVAIFLLIMLLPAISKVIEYINTNGIKGIADTATQFLEGIWAGKGKTI
jgi:type IV secretory pathway component VirB8